MKKFYISDWHYGHNNMLGFDGRPFASVGHMNGELIRRWNDVVAPGDQVYILGDMFWCGMEESIEVLQTLNGQKFLVRGNHDRCNDGRFLKQFANVTEYMEIEDGSEHVVLCHYPIHCFKNHYYGWVHLYGHVHATREYKFVLEAQNDLIVALGMPCRMFNVGCMLPYMDYTPRTLEEILTACGDPGYGIRAEFRPVLRSEENKKENQQ